MKKLIVLMMAALLGSLAQGQPAWNGVCCGAAADTAAGWENQGEATAWHGWRPGVEVTTFFRDAEFFLPYTKGYTATGFFARPFVSHAIGQRGRLTLGLHLAGVAGSEGLREWKPLVRMEYSPHPSWRLVMGSIYGTLQHGLYEPMLDRERFVYAHQEEGVQLIGRLGQGMVRLNTDTWIHWEELLEPWQPKQERFTLGSRNECRLLTIGMGEGEGVLEVGVPFSFLGSHRGGQFSALDTCIQSLFNEQVGVSVCWRRDGRLALGVEAPVFFYQDVSPTKCLPFAEGWGAWPQARCRWLVTPGGSGRTWSGTWQVWLEAGYWRGHQFVAPRGSYLFQSVSWHDPNFAMGERRMATGRVAVENRYGALMLGLDAEVYGDLEVQGTDVAVGLYMHYVF